jgi:hypothetical protein
VTFYRDRNGELCEAAQFKGGRADEEGLCFNGDDGGWVLDALKAKTLELNALGCALILNFRGGTYGLVPGDWVIRKRGGEITQCRGDKFAERYERVDG